MKQTRRKFDSKFKAQVAIEAIKERKTLSSLIGRVVTTTKMDLIHTFLPSWISPFGRPSLQAYAKVVTTLLGDKV